MTKQTFLHDEHVKLGAKMVDFAGWHMPVQYTSIIDEHKTVRQTVGIFDVSHMGEIFIKGKDALKLLNARVNNLETNLHIEIDLERTEDRSKALSYIGIEVAEALKAVQKPAEKKAKVE